MSEGKPASIERICRYLDEAEPFFDTPDKPLRIFTLDGASYYLHVDVNEQHGRYHFMWEWWISGPDGEYIDGGFQPAETRDELAQLAGLIRAAAEDIIARRRAAGD